MTADPKDDGEFVPGGVFSRGVQTERKQRGKEPGQGGGAGPVAKGKGKPAPGRPARPEDEPAELMEEITANQSLRRFELDPEARSEIAAHDGWTDNPISGQKTVPPQAGEFEALLKLSATQHSDAAYQALRLVDQSRPSSDLDLLSEMEELYALDDLTGALKTAEFVLGREPGNGRALRCAHDCRERLATLYASKLGTLSAVVIAALSETEVRWLGLDHRAGFLLSRVDGSSSVEELLDICGMPRLEAFKTLVDLLERGAIRLR